MHNFIIILMIFFFLFSSVAQGKDYIFLVGGGNEPANSQVQIEMNVKWIEAMLRAKGQQLRVFFTDGQAQSADVLTRNKPDNKKATALEPLTRILGKYGDNYLSFRNNQLENVEGSTDAENLKVVLKEAFAVMVPGDRVFFIYQGHGSWEDDESNNALKLWYGTQISAREFEGLLDTLDPGVQFRFFFPQCYSGAFLRLADAQVLAHKNSSQARQCGFTAVSANKMSEGCTVSINEGDYRDYSTYFFAALDGKTRLGEPLASSPDLDGDAKVSLHEAHLYSLDNAYSTDLSRSTSEDFLEQWQPWYLKWKADMSALPDNIFGERVRRVAKNNRYMKKGHELIISLFKHRDQISKQMDLLHAKQVTLQARSAQLKGTLKAGLLNRWPEASLQYTSSFKSFMNTRLDAALVWIEDQKDYRELVMTQNSSASLEKDALDLLRKNTQIDKIFRMIRLSRILEQLNTYGSQDDIATYRSLLACEDKPL
ncbi:MAG: hypothetical protein DSZ28_01060 [Thiothrix sp.]|nr:MAG: hypothetical protein DSZ28_01060 [Thiothrix sp.]